MIRFMKVPSIGVIIVSFLILLATVTENVVLALPTGFIEEVVAQDQAISGTFAPNPRNNGQPMLLLSSKQGIVTILENPDESSTSMVALDISDSICENGERGLQSILIDPDFPTTNLIYLFYTEAKEGCLEGKDVEDANTSPRNILSRFTMDPTTLLIDIDSEDIIWTGPHTLERNHNGGAIAFGNDGKIYLTTGDSGDTSTSQPLNNSFGSVIRLNKDGSIPSDNPFASQNNAFRCADTDGKVPADADEDAVCSEVYAHGFRNPFRITMDPNVKDAVKFTIQDVGGSHYEEISMAGTAIGGGKNYGWPTKEGPCTRSSLVDCPVSDDPKEVEPFHYYAHRDIKEGGCVTGGVFVPEGIWPDEYKYLFIDFVFLEVYNLIESPDLECRTCSPPVPGYKNETFYKSPQEEGEHVNNARMTDLFFGPYKNTQALYIIKYGSLDTVIRIRYTGSVDQQPTALFTVDGDNFLAGESIQFDGSQSSDPEGDSLSFKWDFGDDDSSSDLESPSHAYSESGGYSVTLVVTDTAGQSHQLSKLIVVGQPPEAVILSPTKDDQFFVGEVLFLQGVAYDSTGKEISNDNIEWEVQQHHAGKLLFYSMPFFTSSPIL